VGDVGITYLEQLLASDKAPPFTLVHRPVSASDDQVELLVGDVTEVASLTELPQPPNRDGGPGPARHDLVVLVPYRQIAERGFAASDDGAPLVAMRVREQGSLTVEEVLKTVPDVPLDWTDDGFDIDDQSYGELVRRILSEEIGRGEGANFVIKRSFQGSLGGPSLTAALTLFRRLLSQEAGVYWTFLVHTGARTLVGATPERHVRLDSGTVSMNPISGTYRYPPTGPTVPGLLDFLADAKERDELYMVVDEELKMMARICDAGIVVSGPYLREMTRLAHTEYLLSGQTSHCVADILRETMFVPTVTGSPLENACRVIRRFEREGRGYYSGVLALVGRDEAGEPRIDSAVLIRTADISPDGRLRSGVGATLVQGSRPEAEAAETRAKSAALRTALEGPAGPAARVVFPAPLAERRDVRAALDARNTTLSQFWLSPAEAVSIRREQLVGRRVLVVDGEDAFTAMLEHQLRALGPSITIRGFDAPFDPSGFDLVVLGPGPGDPRAVDSPKIAALRAAALRLLRERRPVLAICLGHQVLCGALGLTLVPKYPPNQGVQQEIDLFGRRSRVGFYNSFAAVCPDELFVSDQVPEPVEVSHDPVSGEVHALRGRSLCSLQFHPESLLSQDGADLLGDTLDALLTTRAMSGRG
jgi:2-amino-4-deoxychorismate synthase